MGLFSSGSTPKIRDYYEDIATPDVTDMELQLQQLVQQGVMTPEDAQAALAGDSAMGGISLDPRLKSAQMDALAGLQDISDNGGMTATDESNIRKIQSEQDASARGAREAIINNANARGMGGSGLDIMAQLQNQQDSAMKASQRGMDVTAQAQDRALQALIQGGTTAGNIANQDFNQKAQVAGAQDAISKFNAQNQQQTNLANTAARNSAQQANLTAKQNVSDTNASFNNQQQQYNKGLQQQDYENKLKKASGQSGIASTNAANAGANSQNSANANNQMIGTALTAAAMFSDERGKCDVEDFDPSDFLDKLTSKKYKYKDQSHGEGDRYGTMAQDLERSDVGASIVKDTPEGKVVDTVQATGPILASLSDLHKRLRQVEG